MSGFFELKQTKKEPMGHEIEWLEVPYIINHLYYNLFFMNLQIIFYFFYFFCFFVFVNISTLFMAAVNRPEEQIFYSFILFFKNFGNPLKKMLRKGRI